MCEGFGIISTCCWPELGTTKPRGGERSILPRVWLSPCVTHQELGWVRSALRNKTGRTRLTSQFMCIELHAPDSSAKSSNCWENVLVIYGDHSE